MKTNFKLRNEKKEKEQEKAETRQHFTKIIDYNEQPWLTDVIIGQKGYPSHAHITLSGAKILYLRDAEGKEIINEDF